MGKLTRLGALVLLGSFLAGCPDDGGRSKKSKSIGKDISGQNRSKSGQLNSSKRTKQSQASKGAACSEEGAFCQLANGKNGFCKQGRCTNPCAPGKFLYGGTHCAKACTGPADCPGGECSDGVCGPLCPPACPYKW